jgi:hypothetical protein
MKGLAKLLAYSCSGNEMAAKKGTIAPKLKSSAKDALIVKKTSNRN